MDSSNPDNLAKLERALTDRFQHWDYLMEHGCSDPTWPDGVNINLVRNHILSCKRQIEDLLNHEEQELTLFPTTFPDIYYRETPPPVPPNLMVKAEEIRSRARAQLALYEQDPNFCYLRDHHHLIFSNGETGATRAAGLHPGKTAALAWFRKVVEMDDLVAMRSRFYRSYEEKAPEWEATAKQFQDFLKSDHNLEDNRILPLDTEQENCIDEEDSLAAIRSVSEIRSLDSQISDAQTRATGQASPAVKRTEQITLF